MKKITLILLFFVTIISSAHAQWRFGGKIGANFANMTIASGGLTLSPDGVWGVQVGTLLERKLSSTLSIQPNLLYSQKGYYLNMVNPLSSSMMSTTTDIRINYLELPINVLYYANPKFLLGGGPYVGYALNGKGKMTFNSMTVEDDLQFGSPNGQSRFDAGLNFIVGYEVMPSYVLNLNYTLGLTNLLTNPSIGTFSGSTKNIVLGFSLIKFFNKQ